MKTGAQKLLEAVALDHAKAAENTPEAAFSRAQAAGRVGTIVGGVVTKPSGKPFRHPHLTIEQQAAIAFDTAPAIRAEFGTLQRYLAYRKWDHGELAHGANGVAS